MEKSAIQHAIEDLMSGLDDMTTSRRYGGKKILEKAARILHRLYPNGCFDESLLEQEMAKIKPFANEFAEMQGVEHARNVLVHLRLLVCDFVDNLRQRFVGGRRGKYYNVKGMELKQNKPKWEIVLKGTPLEFDDAVSFFKHVLRHLPDHLQKLRDEVPLPVAKKQKTEPSPTTENLPPVPPSSERLPRFKVGDECEVKGYGRRGTVVKVYLDEAKFWYDVKSKGRPVDEKVRESMLAKCAQ